MLNIPFSAPPRAENAGLFISPGCGRHADRCLDSFEILYVRTGELLMQEEGVPFRVGRGQCLILRASHRHGGTSNYPADLSFYWLHFRPVGKGSFLQVPQLSEPSRPERVTELFRRFLDDQEAGVLLPQQGNLLVGLILLEIVSPAPGRRDAAEILAGKAEEFIAANFRHGIHAGDVASALGCNPDYLGRVYRRATGRTLSEGIHRRQLAEAEILLCESALNLEEVSRASGFREARYFRKLFAENRGMSPRAYRKLHSRLFINSN